MSNVMTLPSHYILRWTKNAKSGIVLDEMGINIQDDCDKCTSLGYNDLCHQLLTFATKGATSVNIYNTAKHALKRALEEVEAVLRNGTDCSTDQITRNDSHSVETERQSSARLESSFEENQKEKRCGTCKAHYHTKRPCVTQTTQCSVATVGSDLEKHGAIDAGPQRDAQLVLTWALTPFHYWVIPT